MTPEEAARLTELCFPEAPWRAADFLAYRSLPTTRFIWREHGLLLARFVPPEAEILLFAVAPDARRNGVGSRLLDALFTAAAEEGVTEIFLETAEENSAALSLYGRAGFETVGLRKGYYNGQDRSRMDALQMVRTTERP